MIKSTVFASLIIFASSAYAGPKQIEIIGLVPGVSTQTQVENAKSNGQYVIGGYALICISEYIDELLSALYCSTGEKMLSRDTTDSNRPASNTEVHVALLKGFSKKFGPPSEIENSSISNQLGTRFDKNKAVWIDKKGNKLILNSIDTKTNEGSVLLKSAKQVRQDEAESKKTEEQRNF